MFGRFLWAGEGGACGGVGRRSECRYMMGRRCRRGNRDRGRSGYWRVRQWKTRRHLRHLRIGLCHTEGEYCHYGRNIIERPLGILIDFSRE